MVLPCYSLRACHGNTGGDAQADGGRAAGGEEVGWREGWRLWASEDGAVQVRWRRARSESGGGIRGSGGRTVGRPSTTHVVCQCGEVRSLSREACRQETGDDRWEPDTSFSCVVKTQRRW